LTPKHHAGTINGQFAVPNLQRTRPNFSLYARRPSTTTVHAASKGFDSKAKSSSAKKPPKISRYFNEDTTTSSDGQSSSKPDLEGWFQVPDVDVTTTFLSKPIFPIILATGKAICLFKVGDTIYCSDANSTAYQYPLADAKLLSTKNGPVVESNFDGTQYLLESGKVVAWCPKNNPLRQVLGSLKDKSEPVDLRVYPVEIRKEKVWVNLTKMLVV
jgi:nitrite reductase/ring-hydroxylating ferredoxin subunit